LILPNPRGTKERLQWGAATSSLILGAFKAPSESGDRAKRCLSEG